LPGAAATGHRASGETLAEYEEPMSVFLVPVGHDLGPRLVKAGQKSDQYEFLIRVGSHVRHLDSLRFAIWLLAHDSEDGLPDRDGVVDATVRLGLDLEQANVALDELLADGLLTSCFR
jgi:hypothetical protein